MDIKICGITHLDDAMMALTFGADYLGFVFYAGSTRAVTPEQVRRMTRSLPACAKTVGVFVNVSAADARDIVTECRLTAIQLHGEEAAADFRDFPKPVWRAIRFQEGDPLPLPADWPAARYVADRAADGFGHTGGSGRTTDWHAAARLATAGVPLMLAGGLKPDNVADAIASVRPLGVDTAGGVEIACRPGRKDYAKLKRFIETVRRCDDK